MRRWRRSRPRSRPCGRNSIRSIIVSRRTPRPIAAGVWLEERPVREDRLREPPEALLDADARLRARVEPGPPAFLEERLDLARRELGIRVEVLLVHQAERRDVPGDGADRAGPCVEGGECLLPGLVSDREDPFRTVVVRLLEQVPQGRGAHDVPEDRVARHGARALRVLDGHDLLRDLRAQRGDVPVVVLIEHVTPDEGRIPDGRLARHADLQPDRDRGAHGSTSSARSQADCPASFSPRIRCNVALKRHAPGYAGSSRRTRSSTVIPSATRPSWACSAARTNRASTSSAFSRSRWRTITAVSGCTKAVTRPPSHLPAKCCAFPGRTRRGTCTERRIERR